jgi:ribosomal protein L14E/L6E/L27E
VAYVAYVTVSTSLFFFVLSFTFTFINSILYTFLYFSFMDREIVFGDTVVVNGGRHRGKRAIVLDVTPKMVYVQFHSSGARTRIMSYNVILHTDSPTSGIVKELRSMQDTVLNLPKLRTNDGTATNTNYKEAIIKEIRQISDSVDKLATLLQAMDL